MVRSKWIRMANLTQPPWLPYNGIALGDVMDITWERDFLLSSTEFSVISSVRGCN